MDIMQLLMQIIGQQQASPDPQREAIMRRMGSMGGPAGINDMASQQPEQNPNFQTMPHQTMQLPQIEPVAPPVQMPQIGPPGQPMPMPLMNGGQNGQQMGYSPSMPMFDPGTLSRRMNRAF
jgi:hypothetical protein